MTLSKEARDRLNNEAIGKQEIAFAGERGMPIWYLDPAEVA